MNKPNRSQFWPNFWIGLATVATHPAYIFSAGITTGILLHRWLE